MDELVELVSKKAGISKTQSQKAVSTVMSFMNEKLPAPLAQQVQTAMQGGAIDSLDDIAESLGSLLGGKN
jgi:hypothetical protein